MEEYPKIETLFDRDSKTFQVIESKFRLPEFNLIKEWYATEKIDGTNIRVGWVNGMCGDRSVEFGGRTAEAQMPTFLLKYLQDTLTSDKMAKAFPDLGNEDVTLFGEGYGPKIQSGGKYRVNGVSFRLFDVKIGRWWLEQSSIIDIALKLGIGTVPALGALPIDNLIEWVRVGVQSKVAYVEANQTATAEGIVARTVPLLFDRRGERLMWKLKARDFRAGKR